MAKKKYTQEEREDMDRRTAKQKGRNKSNIPQAIIYDDEIQPRKSANLEYSDNKQGGGAFDWFMAFTVIIGALVWFM